MPDYQIYRLRITVLTPLHIGNGREMLNQYDYAIHDGRTWRINENALLDTQSVEDPRVAASLMRFKPAQLLLSQDFKEGNRYFRYILEGTPKSEAEGAVLREQIKDVFDHPYVPGTTIKGALRTALAWSLWGKKKLRPEISKLRSKPKFAASDYEHDLFGKDPNHDLLRALQVSDSASLDASALMLVNVRVLTGRGKPGSQVEVEALRPQTVVESEVKLDTALFSSWAKARGLQLGNSEALMDFVQIARQYSLEAIQREQIWARRLPNERVVRRFQTMLDYPLQSNQFFLQVGWGGGWEQKTLGEHLKSSEDFMRAILKPEDANGWGVGRGHIPKNVQDFPTSRRIAMVYRRDAQGDITAEIPDSPLGWVLVSMLSDDLAIPETDWQPEFTEDDDYTPSASVIDTPQEEKMPVVKPILKPLIENFEAIPQIGDRFKGEVFSQEGRALELFIPGLDDTVAAAYIGPDDNPTSKKYAEGDIVICEVIGLKQIGRICQVQCRKV
ncbi:MAG: type III-A CRISPR-associated RAMP protein Csm5 [Anaerolineae bacterium]|jgi:CRISPR-associated protein Csm5|nr:type III-A CRISPR-associated RAMP protein Csm5 [Anaerolineae bacterium]